MGAPKHKLLAGIGLYGRSFTLQTPANNGFGAATIGAGRAGIYTREPGFLSFYEVYIDTFLFHSLFVQYLAFSDLFL
ncbi:hypothetical protein DPMN_034706 [Dreissena polymorpha]|uniref:Chitinase n=1 Tax=Dreissena polymorpha TaxID=45954 RepID=A0A9D4M7Z5_DREPO|nr:hypothetical protein DPMN_034706 [Dreissena polymorpha]